MMTNENDPKYQKALLQSYRRENYDLSIKLSSEKVRRRNAESEVRQLKARITQLEKIIE